MMSPGVNLGANGDGHSPVSFISSGVHGMSVVCIGGVSDASG